jgi:S-methylmethionine-dependent homocysteine/selenocysteine methylase
MNMLDKLRTHELVLTEAAVIETLRRSGKVELHPLLENALLIYEEDTKKALSIIYQEYISVAHDADIPIIVCSPTWRANRERVSQANVTDEVNSDAVEFLKLLKETWGSWDRNIYTGGLLGCKNDCYKPEEGLSTDRARVFHSWQVSRLAGAGVDFLLAATLPAIPEAKGIALAMQETTVPHIISFVINRQGSILDGTSLEEAFGEIDDTCARPPFGYMINCAYPSFLNAHNQPDSVLTRLIGFQANASSLDHSELENAASVRIDDVSDWGSRMIELNRSFGVKILGGCCGTSSKHLEYIVQNLGYDRS